MFKSAADAGEERAAQFNLAVAYSECHGTSQNEVLAAKWFKESCDNGIQAGCPEP